MNMNIHPHGKYTWTLGHMDMGHMVEWVYRIALIGDIDSYARMHRIETA